MKLALVFNLAPKYREAIYSAIDKKYDCDWYFGGKVEDIKGFDISLLKHAEVVDNRPLIHTSLYRQHSVFSKVMSGKYDGIIMIGEPFNLTTWKILISSKFKKKRPKIYLWSHGWYGREGYCKKIIKRVYFRLADHVFTYGEYAKKIAIEQGFNESKLTAIHNSLNYPVQKKLREKLKSTSIYCDYFRNNNPVLIFIGRLTYVKKLNVLINAVAELNRDKTPLNLIFVGDGEAKTDLQNQVSTLDINNRIWFYGECYDEEINAELIYNADLCVSPGNVGLTAIHSLMFGTPVITHNDFKNQMPEFEAIKQNETGAFFEYGNLDSLKKTIIEWFENHNSDREKVRKACFDEVDTQWTPEFQLNVLRKTIG